MTIDFVIFQYALSAFLPSSGQTNLAHPYKHFPKRMGILTSVPYYNTVEMAGKFKCLSVPFLHTEEECKQHERPDFYG